MLPADADLSDERKQLIGAYFTQEYSFESAAYFNPSIVAHPDQSGLSFGYLRIILSIRAVGEGHISSLVFRSGIINPAGEVLIDTSPRFATTHAHRYSLLNKRLVHQAATEIGMDTDELDLILGMLPEKFTAEELDMTVSQLHFNHSINSHPNPVHQILQNIAHNSYEVDFEKTVSISEQVLWPTSADERRGIEDARWVRFIEPDGEVIYRATYTGFDGQGVKTRLFETRDFKSYSSTHLTGSAVANKGMAFFPKKIDGRYFALSRWDRESNSIALSDDGYHWDEARTFQEAARPWELVHIGNCGSPLETSAGWLVITHGTGPMREYSLGAILLDLEDPTKIIGQLNEPLLIANARERDGYVPNVVYSCGGLIHNDILFLPYGFSDQSTSLVTVNVNELIGAMNIS